MYNDELVVSQPLAPGDEYKCGHVAIIGRPNVGKSTLLNHLVGKKVSIVTRKPQTTKNNILGIKTHATTQIIYVDTPGMHSVTPRLVNRHLNKTAKSAALGVDLILLVIAGTAWTNDDELVLNFLQISEVECPVILVVNKIDMLANKDLLLPHFAMLHSKYNFAEIIPTAALTNINLPKLENLIIKYLPTANEFIYPTTQYTDKNEHFIAAELIREKIMYAVSGELPYTTLVTIEKFTTTANLITIHALIWVERQGQKVIIIGKQGAVLKSIATKARLALERQFGNKVFLQIWIKVRDSWTNDIPFIEKLLPTT